MNYLGCLTGRKCRGLGYAEILIEAGLVTSGCLESVQKGKAYAKAMFCLKTVIEAMERLLFQQFIEEQGSKFADPDHLMLLTETCNRENLNQALCESNVLDILQQYAIYEEKVRKGHLGKTATFWFSVIEHARLILMLQYVVKTNNFALFHKCNGEMAHLFFAYDGPNYSRYD